MRTTSASNKPSPDMPGAGNVSELDERDGTANGATAEGMELDKCISVGLVEATTAEVFAEKDDVNSAGGSVIANLRARSLLDANRRRKIRLQ